jgi:hypothetical protein
MTKDKDERKRPQLRLVVNNPEKRNPRPKANEEALVTLEELLARREDFRPAFYADLPPWQAKAFGAIERFLAGRGWPYGLDPQHGRPLVIPAGVVCPAAAEHDEASQDEVLLHLAEDPTGQGGCLTLEMLLPFWSDDDGVMEEALLFSPIFPYGALFLEENKQDGYLDLIYRVSFPLYPPALTNRLLSRFFAVAGYELTEALRSLAE